MARRPGLDEGVIVRAAADLVDAEGRAALALGRLAERLGVRAPSLYNHVTSLDGLMQIAQEMVMDPFRAASRPLVPAGDGRLAMAEQAHGGTHLQPLGESTEQFADAGRRRLEVGERRALTGLIRHMARSAANDRMPIADDSQGGER